MAKKAEKQKVLIVEDYEPSVQLAALCLEELGYSYDIASNGNEALKKFKKIITI